MSETTIAIIGLAGNLTLVAVTAFYALLTRSMATASKESARASVDAAQYAAQAVQASLAALDVEFKVTPQKITTDIQRPGVPGSVREMSGIRVESVASNVFVHSARIEYYGYRSPDVTLNHAGLSGRVVSQDLPVVLQSGPETGRMAEISAPLLLHKSESADFLFEGDLEIPAGAQLRALQIVVSYALDAKSEPRERLVTWKKEDPPLLA